MATKSIYKLEDERLTSDSIVHKDENNVYKNLKGILNFKNQILWEGAVYMQASHNIQLSQKISDQKHGIVLIFSGYTNGKVNNNNHTCYFIPKSYLDFWETGAVVIPCGGTDGIVGSKYIYVHDDRLTGNDNNATTNNKQWVLSQVIGV